MQKYFNYFLDEQGNRIAAASVLVKTNAGGAATIYSDNSGTMTTNPLTTDGSGYFEFYAPNGTYSLVLSKIGYTTVTLSAVLLDDPTVATIAALKAAGIPTTANAKVTVVEDGRAGDFYWVTGDQSANVTADPQSWIWVAPDSDSTGASGAWKRLPTEATTLPVAMDNFETAGAINGRLPVFGPNAWVTSGAGAANATAVDGYATSTANTYCNIDLDQTPFELVCVFEWKTAVGLCTLAFVKDFITDGISTMWHVNLAGSTGVIRGSYWDLGTAVSDVTPQFTSGLAISGLVVDTKYRFRALVDGKWSHSRLESLDGTILGTRSFYDDMIPSVIGQWAFVQLHDSNIRVHEFYARAKPVVNTRTFDADRTAIEGTPIGLSMPSHGNFHSLCVGSPTVRPYDSPFTVNLISVQESYLVSEQHPTLNIKTTAAGFMPRIRLMHSNGTYSQIYSSGNAYDIRLYTNGADRFVVPYTGYAYIVDGAMRTGGSAGPIVQGKKVSADKGDAAATLTAGTSEPIAIWDTPLTADRAVTLSGGSNGFEFKIVRTANATGAFNLNVGTGPLKAMGTAGSYCVVSHNGTAWILTEYGTL